METFSALLATCAGNSPVRGEFPAQRPVTRNFDALVDLHPKKLLIKQRWGYLRRHRAHRAHSNGLYCTDINTGILFMP